MIKTGINTLHESHTFKTPKTNNSEVAAGAIREYKIALRFVMDRGIFQIYTFLFPNQTCTSNRRINIKPAGVYQRVQRGMGYKFRGSFY